MNKFLNNVNEGENNLWRYFITIILSFILSNIIAGFLLGFGIILYSISTGNMDINVIMDFIENYDSNLIFLFIMVFVTILFSMIFLFISLKFIHKRDFMSLFNVSKKYDEFTGKTINWFNRIRWNRILKGILVWLAFLLLLDFISYIIEPTSYSINFNIDNFYLIIFLFLLAIPIQVTFEELFFRGYLNQGLSLKIKSPLIIILISSSVFSLGHIANGGMEPIFMIQNLVISLIIGIIFSVATLVDNGIELAIGAHFINNFYAFLIHSAEGSLGNFETIIQTTEGDPAMSLVFSTIAILIFGLILFIYKKEDIIKVLTNK